MFGAMEGVEVQTKNPFRLIQCRFGFVTCVFVIDHFPGAGAVFANVRSMTKLLAHYGVRDYRRASTRVTAGIVDATDAARLDLALGRPVLVVDSTDVGTDDRPLVTKRARFAAERVEFLIENS